MTLYEFEDSVWKLLPRFFPEIKEGGINNNVFIDARSNHLMLAITFYKPKVASNFESKIQKLNQFMTTAGIPPIPNEIIKPEINTEKQEETYYYQIPVYIAQGFTNNR